MQGLYIGELAKRAKTNPKTIRYYEEIGLLSHPTRNASGYRVYSEPDIELLRFIHGAKALGLTLEEVKRIVDMWSGGTLPCPHVSQILDEKLEFLDRRIAQLTTFRDDLRAYKTRVESIERPANVPCVHIAGAVSGLWAPASGSKSI